jgi:hypothetical protein
VGPLIQWQNSLRQDEQWYRACFAIFYARSLPKVHHMSSALGNLVHPEATKDTFLRYVLWLLMLSCTLNFLDRQVINILAEPIKHEFQLTDAQLGLLTGLAFAAFPDDPSAGPR